MELATPLLGVGTLAGLKVPQLAVNFTFTPAAAAPSTIPTTDTDEVPRAAILAGEAAKLESDTLAAVVLKLRLDETVVLLTVVVAVSRAAPVVVRSSGLINIFATPLLSVNAAVSEALPAKVATVYVVEKVTNWLGNAAPLESVTTAFA